MALFGKSTAEDIIKLYNKLSDEEKEKAKSHFGEKVEDIKKAEDEREVDKIEEDKAETEEVKKDKAEDVKEESKEIGKDVDEAKAEEPTEEIESPVETETESDVEETQEEVEEVEERHEDLFNGLDARLKALEDKFNKLLSEEMKEPQHKEIGISGYGSSEVDNNDVDTRKDDMIKKLGGYAR